MASRYQVIWLHLALRDLSEIGEFIAQEDDKLARKIAKQIWQAGQGLSRYPERARIGRVPGTRELVLAGLPFFIAFRVVSDTIQILRIIHTARRWPPK